MKNAETCACGSDIAFVECCGAIIRGIPAPTAEALMRSRYTAFVLGDLNHLRASWHPGTCPADLALDPDVTWTGLDVVSVEAGKPGDRRGYVAFRAHWREHGRRGILTERSRFVWQSERWWYLDGEVVEQAE
ncbi:SEC-C motif-containing protein [Microbacterium halimionae]|uniref:SEC-C motif-containing protein n=1 Tax=Microbacterium halimionae TaxID=1526413 RepID=A0A7W3JNS4_9MICO|nr:YchJ family metal-binding protein [Microbacterium halimionae]MBA8816263.1 SEC-C motif-containing protein [Microbacterium halimionae]NII96466.1 SEC-C motif-containing protein [Microbacterium halimionae]